MARDNGGPKAGNGATHMTAPVAAETREKFLPVTKAALMDRLTRDDRWPGVPTVDVRRFFRYLDYWRQQQYTMRLLSLQDRKSVV